MNILCEEGTNVVQNHIQTINAEQNSPRKMALLRKKGFLYEENN